MKRFAAIAGLIFAIALATAHAQQGPDDQYIVIYNLMQQADTLQAAGQPRQALDGYTQALAELQKFQKLFPDWDSNIVSFRLNYVTEKINSLSAQFPVVAQGGAPSIPTNAPATNALPAAPAAPATPATDADMQLSALRSQVQALQVDNETLQAKLKEALSARPAAVDTQELVKAQARVVSLMKENDLLRASRTNSPAGVAAPEELSKLRQALADANQKLAEQTSRVDKLALENQSLQSAASINGLEKAALEKRLKQQQAPAVSAPAETSGEIKTLRARLAVDEAKAVPYTPEELALLKSPPPTPAATNAGEQKKSTNELPAGSGLLVAEAQSFFSAGAFDKAEADYRQILEREPNNALALANLAAIEMQENKLADAETHIAAALAQTPDDSYTLSTFGFLKFRQQKFDEAFDALSRAAKLDPENPQIQNYLGVTLSHKGLQAQAETALRKAVELDPSYGAAHNNLAVIYMAENPPMAELARWHYQKALDLGEARNPDLEKKLADLGAPVSQ